MCLLDLPENLRLAHHHRVEAGGDAEQVPCRLQIGARVDVRGELSGRNAMELGDELRERVRRLAGIVAGGVQLGAVARRHHDRFAGGAALCHLTYRVGQTAGVEVEPLPQLHGRRLMADSDQQQVQGLWL